MSPKRSVCAVCHYPQTTCICNAVVKVDTNIKVTVLQHPNETGHAKNTVRLLALVLPTLDICVGDKSVDFSAMRKRLGPDTLVVYPSESAKPITQLANNNTHYQHIVLLDGSWRQAKKIWLSNHWLAEFDSAIIDSERATGYTIRKAPHTNSLSTLEATALILNAIDEVPLSPFYSALTALTTNWQKYSMR
ncbi:tRNA-uridine aminocarboxypropyltransferase [Alteromonas sp. ASW11-36]|uniref:tRNA-uridine aminocarboxypropyltransferase n=1 Tax=Alteromonas arenosi TaxID=3055817 RepID=A0ABT7SUN2_9ALTE|nr:tRNA-uridine aminocarboxypropyltransferase [Alteromonas sp. ASW11-36]MDM7859897.1 tRNA-uridine aminocarboxypropyltransferase [Alteromonas sp. ASW11-36]